MPRKAKKAGAKGMRGVRLDRLDAVVLRAALDRKLKTLTGERAVLVVRLAELDREIATLGGAAPVAKVKVAAKGKAKAKAGRGPREGNTLGNTLVALLGKASEPMSVKNLVIAVRASDYGSKSVHLRSMVNQTLSKDGRFRKVKRGLYVLA